MLSNTAETKPSANAVCHDAAGSAFTGMSEAHHTSESRNTAPFAAPGSSSQAGRRHSAPIRIAPTPTSRRRRSRRGRTGSSSRSRRRGSCRRSASCAQSIGLRSPRRVEVDRLDAVLEQRRRASRPRAARRRSRRSRARRRVGRDAVDPHHRGGGVAEHAPRAARVAGGDDRRRRSRR